METPEKKPNSFALAEEEKFTKFAVPVGMQLNMDCTAYYVAIVIGVEPILDMFGTAQSVLSNITASFLACRKEHFVNEEIYRQFFPKRGPS